MWPDDPITESPGMVSQSRIDLPLRPPLHHDFNAARGIMWGQLFGAELWLVIVGVVLLLVACVTL